MHLFDHSDMTQHDIRAEQAIASATDASITSDAAQSPLDKLDALLNPSAAVAAPAVDSGFAALGLDAAILRALSDLNYNSPTPVQAQAIPAFLAGRDLLVSSQTGSGKTAAFMLPAIQRISEMPAPQRPTEPAKRMKGKRPRPAPAQPALLVLTPTRELALQVTEAAAKYGRNLRRIVCASILGGMPYPKQLAMLAKMPDILVATPGRLLDHIDAGRIDLSALQMLVFDEADRMLDMGFADDIDAIVNATPAARQTLMFSATLDARIAQLASRQLKDPQRIEIAAARADQSHIEQRLHFTDDMSHKERLLDHLLRDASLKQAIVFTATKRDADSLAERLSDTGFSAGALHGDMTQGARNRTLTALRRGNLRVLVATDVAARGIDVPDITHVVNFDLPKQAEDYVHRIGRTGRAGRSGIAINLVNHNDMFQWKRIERFTNNRVDASVIEGLEPRRSPKPRSNFGGKPGGGRGDFRGNGGGNGGYRGGERSFGDRKFGGDNRTGFGERKFGGDSRGFGNRTEGARPFGDDNRGGFGNREGGYRGQGGQGTGYRGASDGARGFGNREGGRTFGDDNRGGFGNRDGNRGFGDSRGNGGGYRGNGGNGEGRSFGNRDGNRGFGGGFGGNGGGNRNSRSRYER
ncbi:modular protein:DEAD/DEAH box helicase (N-terminal); ATP-DEPENDENT RNA HELICASE (C-terminal)(rhlE-like) [Cupriavidus phytorum]|uniref:Modular protein:DEAD/DEAH box helicase (N-terminal) ATP-DEPENDENT RNA HELICASE (C-terminal)(RhlE-like) n=3 Tax=Cupriavidus TaxID=106589 RepID=A0A375C6Q8_9BURK|nr:superfamily II DNA/RNA helicase [Cupriavidus alkaliphilus]SOY63767.1 modular protein:DEAD/DEAH box helicase (N-terminal); ATP-DEPENDENT RNA HELICASE (C-terminal)(rhlE-like) [Cupriavidus taiwanensis]